MLSLSILLLASVHTAFSQECKPGYTLNSQNSRCFKVFKDPQNYISAMAYCNRDGAILATIENSFVNSFVGSLLESDKFHYIGLNELMQTNVWKWVDGTPYTYSNWAQGQGGDCGAIPGVTFRWGNIPCSTLLPFICMTDAILQPTQPTCPRHSLCETGWTYFNETDSCYRTFSESPCNHSGAEAICDEGAGGHLASIHSLDELYFISEIAATGMPQDATHQVIIGHLKVNGTWTWTDGSLFDFETWAPGAPWTNDTYGYLFADEYVKASGYRYKFGTYNTSTTLLRAFVCKKASIA